MLVLASTGVFAQYQEQQKIIAFDGLPVDWFGREIACSGDGNTMIVGAVYDDVDEVKDCGSA